MNGGSIVDMVMQIFRVGYLIVINFADLIARYLDKSHYQ